MAQSERFQRAIECIDEENRRDPHGISVGGVEQPREWVYSTWVTEWVLKLRPEAPEAMLLAARSQHICRWMIPRASYEMNRAGYLKWRADLKKFHAARTAEILQANGYPDEVIARVRALNLKENLASDPECQVIEDALCLVTLEHQVEAMIEKTDSDKMTEIIRKTWKKMSASAREHALGLPVVERHGELFRAAVG
jgi:hypothetical protein